MGAHFRGHDGTKQAMHRRAERDFSKTSTSLTAGKEPFVPGDTIAAISTPAGEGAIALVRISGVKAIEVAEQICRGTEKPSRFASHVQHFGEIVDGEGPLVDQLMLSLHRPPASSTADDFLEIS